ncbi:60S ribosomal protein L2, putative [Leishmania tarentolae]|uniref:60S ribosomal protein L2, putative n=1 Tax=Leishmania tarentolae TaxID=5689 RepID=A0A640KYN8_LEITA|nr:60S ribosomal protein L2, putative [Leishmania tarentolae]GET92649.1 60S ribosomal protein L2, putative [Leishmania tarentolae]
MVTTTVRVLHRVAGDTTHLGPAVALAAEAVERVTGLQHGLLDAAAAADDANHRAARARHGLLLPARQLQTRAACLVVVRDDDAVVAGRARQRAAVTRLRLHVAHDAALRDLAQGQHVADRQRGLLAAEHRLAGEHALRRHHQLLHAAKLVRVTELHARQRRTAASLVLDRLHHTAHVAVALGVVQNAQLGGAKALVAVHLVHRAVALTAAQHSLAHG